MEPEVLKATLMECLESYAMPRALVIEKMNRTADAIEAQNEELRRLNGTVRADHDAVVKFGEWQTSVERRLEAATGIGTLIVVLQTLWAPVAAFLVSLFGGGNQ
jgi:hypothetical protein